MNLRQIQIIMTVAELGSISRAAERLHVAQPALSRQIRLSEEELGIDLFVRSPHGMIPTSAGRLLVSRAPGILSQLDDLRADVLSMADEVSGHLIFGAPPAIADRLAGSVIQEFRASFPKVTLRIIVGISGQVAQLLRNSEVDVAVLYEVPEIDTLNTEPLLDERLFLVGPQDAALSMDEPVRFRQLSGKRFVLPGRENAGRRVVEDLAVKFKVPIDVPIEVDSIYVTKHLVE